MPMTWIIQKVRAMSYNEKRMRLPTRLDSFVESALLGTLDPMRRRLLTGELALAAVGGATWGCWHPEMASLSLLFPAVVLAFFGCPARWGLAWVALFSWLRPVPLEVAEFGLAVAVGTLFAHVTVDRYRQSRTRQLELERVLDLARRRQQQLEPAPRQVLLERLEVTCWMRMSRQLGGDFLCVERLDDQRVTIILGDVMGKGLAAAMVAVSLEGVCHQLADRGLEPAQIVAGLNRSLAGFAPQDTLFATAICLEVDFGQHLWKVCRAGHELPSRADLAGLPHLPLGLDPRLDFTQSTAPLRVGESLLLASDGATDVLGDLQALDVTRGLPPRVAHLGEERADDATLALLRVLA